MTQYDNYMRKAKGIYWPTQGDIPEGIETGHRDIDDLLFFSNQHGEWILQMKDDGEVARHNARYLESIVWEDEQEQHE